jgi:hypothetical protein
VGAKPKGSPSLADDDLEFQRVATDLWGSGSNSTVKRAVGRGAIFPSKDLGAALAAIGLTPDWQAAHDQSGAEDIAVLHRTLSDGDFYFLSNRTNRPITTEFSIRGTGKAPEFWRADDGTSEDAAYRASNGRTVIPLAMDPDGAVFIVLRKPAQSSSREIPETTYTNLQSLDGPWRLEFQPGRGAPASMELDQLRSWTELGDPGARYFSGIGTYTKAFEVPPEWAHRHLLLNLGDVHEVASVMLNGEPIATAWKSPYRVDLTGRLKAGRNIVTVRVANLWVNRLIGDAQPGAQRYTVTNGATYRPDAPLRISGLLGPVLIQAVN